MPTIPLLSVEALSAQQQIQYRRFPTNLTLAILGTSCAEQYLSLGIALAKSPLPSRDRELVILRVASLSNSEYERMQHLHLARASGWSDQQIASIESGQPSGLDERARTLLRFVDECIQQIRVSEDTLDRVRVFLGDVELADLTLLIGHYMMTARFLATLRVPLDDRPADWTNALS